MFSKNKQKIIFIGGFWMGKSDIVYQMYISLKKNHKVKLLNTDKNRDVLDTLGRDYDYGTNGPVYIRYEKLAAMIKKFKPTMVICCAGGLSFRKDDLEKFKNIKLIGIALSDPDVFENTTSKIASNFDLFYTNAELSIAEYEKLGYKVGLLPFAGNPVFHKRLGPTKKYSSDILLIGNYRPDRVEMVRAVMTKYDLKIFGEGWEQADIKSCGHIEGKEMVKAINSAKICLDFPRTMAGYDNVKYRLFEYGCCGALVFTGYSEEIAKYFEYDKEIVGYHNQDELISKIGDYLENAELSENIRENIYTRCTTDHTWARRWERVFQDAETI